MAPAGNSVPGRVQQALDAALAAAETDAIEAGLEQLHRALGEVRLHTTPEEWERAIQSARAHPLRELLHLDPFTLRCYAKPRGYTPDGVALDYVLRARALPDPPAHRIAALHGALTNGATARALRFRRDRIAEEIEHHAGTSAAGLRLFAAGCGHLREWDRVGRAARAGVRELTAFDLDPQNIAAARADYRELPLVGHVSRLREIARGDHTFRDMDLVYCCGLLEALPTPAALGLARSLFGMLAHGGTLVLTHFLPGLPEAAYLEAFMDWRMAYRSQSDFFTLVQRGMQEATAQWSYGENAESTLGVMVVQRR